MKMWWLFVFILYFPFIQSCPVDHIILPGADWTQIKNDIDGEAAGDLSGTISMSSDGSTVAIGAVMNSADETQPGFGHVRVYRLEYLGWTQMGDDIDGEYWGEFSGFSVSLSSNGRILAVGSQSTLGAHVRIYEWGGAGWSSGDNIYGLYLEGSNTVALSSDGDTLAIGSHGGDYDASFSCGSENFYQGVVVRGGKDPKEVCCSPPDNSAFTETLTCNDHPAIRGLDEASKQDLCTPDYGCMHDYCSYVGSRVLKRDPISDKYSPMAFQSACCNVTTCETYKCTQYKTDFEYTECNGNVCDDDQCCENAIGDKCSDIFTEESGSWVLNKITDHGVVRVFKKEGFKNWVQQGEAIQGASLGDESSEVSISSDGTTVAIGAQKNNGNGEDSGHVRVYKWDGTGWNQVGTDIDGDASGDMSGSSVSLSSDGFRVAIGAYFNDGGSGNNTGHVRVYEYLEEHWVQMGDDLDGEGANDESGEVSLSSDGTTVAIGAPKNNGNGEDSGHVRVYKWDGSVWNQVGTDIDGETAGDLSGFVSMSSDGSTVAIGAIRNDGNGEDSGHVRVYSIECYIYCNVGKYLLETTSSCVACPRGTYGYEANATSCTACMVGRYQPLEGQAYLSACYFCHPGKYSDLEGATDASDCKDCPLGFYNKFDHSNECYNCGGQHGDNYADETGLTECKDCPLGYFQEGYGATADECETCGAGKYVTLDNLNNNITVCVSCHQGLYQDEIGKYGCKQCSVDGTYAGENLTACSDCPNGYYSSSFQFSYDYCGSCGPGRFQNDLQGAWCVDCSSGTYNDENGQGECKTCTDAGTYATGLKQTSCADCPAGYDSVPEICDVAMPSVNSGTVSWTHCAGAMYSGGIMVSGGYCGGSVGSDQQKEFYRTCCEYINEPGDSDDNVQSCVDKYRAKPTIEYIGDGTCTEIVAWLAGNASEYGYWLPRLSSDHPLADTDPAQECANRCAAKYGVKIGGVYVGKPGTTNDGLCGKCATDCTLNAGFGNSGLFKAYKIVHAPLGCTACSAGKYQTDTDGAVCQDCPAGFVSSEAASSCDEINECDASPCVNGNCTDLVNDYNCTCTLGYEGVNCDTNMDDCASSPCVNGNCTDLVNDYTCSCEPGYEGVNCEIDIDYCANVTCIGKGTCIDEVNGYFCKPYKVTGDFNFYVLAVWVGIAAVVLICVGLKSTHNSIKEYVDSPSNPIKETKQMYW